MPTTVFGEHLKREREMRGVSLEEIAVATKIAPRFLEALENEQWEQLPGGAFNRGFIRSVARYLGMDEDDLVAEYALVTKDRVEPGVFTPPPLQRSRKWIALAVAILLVFFLLLGGWLLITRFGPRIFSRTHKTHAVAVSPAPHAAPAISSPKGSAVPRTKTPPAAKPVPASPPPPSRKIRESKNAAAAPPAAAVASPAVRAATGPLELKVQVTKLSKVRVVADGRILLDRHLKPGQTRHFRARDIFEVASTDAGALQLILNGEAIPPPGMPGRSGGVTLTHKDVKAPDGGRH